MLPTGTDSHTHFLQGLMYELDKDCVNKLVKVACLRILFVELAQWPTYMHKQCIGISIFL